MKNLLLLPCLLCWTAICSQQLHFFGDTLQQLIPATPMANVIHQGIYSYMPNRSTDSSRSVSTVIKIDTSGKTIWTAFPTNYVATGIKPVNIDVVSITLGVDNNIYTRYNTGEIGKIRGSNGSTDWIVPLQPAISYSRAALIDYDSQTLLIANALPDINKVRLIRYNKSKGQNLGYIDLPCTAPDNFGIYIAGPVIYLASLDSVYRFTSYDNPILEWKVKSGTDRYFDIQSLSVEGNSLFVFGNKESGFHNGMLSCVDITTGTLKWFVKNGGAYDLVHADHKIKNGFLYTSWKHLYVGSTTERCFLNRINISTGVKSWEGNYAFRTQAVSVSVQEAMISMDIDDNETLYLTGYGLPDNQTSKSWAFMKMRGSDATILKRSFIQGSDASQDYPNGITTRLINGKLYATGQMPGNVAIAGVDTVDLSTFKTNLCISAIQYPSSVVGIRNVSKNKKMIVRKIGKSLKVEMMDVFLNTLWTRTIGDTLYPYEGIDVMGVIDSTNISYITARRYNWATNNHFFFSQATSDTFYLISLDSAGIINGKFVQEDVPFQNPYQFFQDSSQRGWLGTVVGTNIGARNYPTYVGTVSGKWTPRPYTLIKPATYFHYDRDTIILFKEPTGAQFSASLAKTWPNYLPVAHAKYYYNMATVRWFNSAEREDKENFYVAAKDSSMNDMIFKYNVRDSNFIWTKKFDPSILTLKGYACNGSFYAVSTQGDNTFVRKFNGANGDILWTKNITVLPGHVFKIGDFAMSKQRQKITLAGYLVDTLIKDMSKVYILTFDTSGNDLNTFISGGYSAWQNKATTITIGQDGQTLVSGQMTDSTYGYAGFIYEADTTSLKLSIQIPQVVYAAAVNNSCSDTARKTGKLLNPLLLPYDIVIKQDNNIVLPFNWADSTFSYSVATPGNRTISVSYTYGGTSSVKDTSFTIKATPAAGAKPVQNGTIITAPATGNAYQWYINGNSINGATTNTLTISQSGLYKYTYTVDGCTAPSSPELNVVYTSIVDPTNNNAIITISPNPSNGILVARNLNPASQYGIKIIAVNGVQVKGLTLISRGSTATIDLQSLATGNYILQLFNVSKHVLIGRQKLVLTK